MTTNRYSALIEHQRNWLFGLPPSRYLENVLRLRVSPEEADILARIPHVPVPLDDISKKLELPPEEVIRKLDDFAARGLVMVITGKKGNRYCLADAFFWFYRMPGYAGPTDDIYKALAPLLNKYYTEAMAEEVLKLSTRALRAIPINRAVTDPRSIRPYEDILDVVDRAVFVSVSTCACRHRKNMDPDSPNCDYPMETCLHLDKLGRYLIQYGIGRELSKPEALKLMETMAEIGLVHAVSNMQHGIDTICNCCPCCCAFLESRANLSQGVIGHQHSSYVLSQDEGRCKQCGLCTQRCPVRALELVHEPTGGVNGKPVKRIIFRTEKCLGCGVCAHKCPTQALSLKYRERDTNIPENAMDFVTRVLTEQGVDLTRIF